MKYELTNDTIEVNGVTLYRVRALKDFADVKAGDLGGYVQSEANLLQEGDCWVFANACVCGKAQVSNNAQVYGNALVAGAARVFGNASVYGNARVYGEARVCSNARVFGNASVFGNARVFGAAQVYDYAQVYGAAQVGNTVRVFGAWVYGDAYVYGDDDVALSVRVYDNDQVRICNQPAATSQLSYKDVLQCKALIGDIDKMLALTKAVGYEYFLWNDRVYTVGGAATGLTVTDIKE